MAEVNKSLLKNSSSIGTIQDSLNSFGKSLRKANSASSAMIRGLYTGNRDKKSAIIKQRELFQKRREAVQKREREDVIESGKVGSILKRTGSVISGSTKGFLGRIMDFVGFVMVGWMLNNLPRIIKGTQELIGRIQSVLGILSSWTNGLFSFFTDFGSQLGAITARLFGFDIGSQEKEVNKQVDKTNSGIVKTNQDLERMIRDLEDFDILERLGLKGEDLLADIDPSQPPGSGAAGIPGTGGRLKSIHKQALDIISGPESGGNYNAMNNGQAGDRPGGAKKWLGKNLTDMSIGEVMDFQNNKKTLWAAGRYQFVPNTLPGVMKSAGLTPRDKFDEANQDLMAIALLKQRGLQPWTVGGSKYSAAERAIVEQARRTPLGSAMKSGGSAEINNKTRYSKGQNITSIVGANAVVTSLKGPRWGRDHSGIDIACSPGLYISLRVDSEVVGYKWDGGYGHVIDIWVPSLNVQLRFGHNSRILIGSGSIPAGTSFAITGSTGRSTGPHIHLEADSRKNRTEYKSNMQPDPYVALIKLTGAQISGGRQQEPGKMEGVGGPSLEGVPTQTGVQERITPERKGQTVMLPMPMGGGAQQAAPAPQGGGGGTTITLGGGDRLNSFVTQTLLKELEYT